MQSILLVVLITGLISQSDATVYREDLNVQEIELLFGEDGCIEGTISVSETNPVVHSVVYAETLTESKEGSSSKNEESKSPQTLINELAVFNKIPFQYTLTEEEGPDHNKYFTVSLVLGKEEYIGEGNSIKNARHSAARLALKKTQHLHPPIKSVNKQPHKIKNPVDKLQQVVSKFKDITIKYTFKNHSIIESSKYHKNHYHENVYSDPTVHEVTVQFGQLSFVGHGSTSDSAKQQAANNALKELNSIDGFCSLENRHDIFKSNGNKCPISLINEFAAKSKLKVSFDVTDEEGPSHMKVFTIKCKIGDKLESNGKGTTKQSAKKEAALNMLKQLKVHAYTNGINCDTKLEKIKPKRKTKTIVKSDTFVSSNRKAIPDDNNPVSKLTEIQQKSYNKNPPIFTLLEEKFTTNKQFSIQVKVGDIVYVGSGPSKKIAKRKAAEGMLQILGYSVRSKEIRDFLSVQKKKAIAEEDNTIMKKQILGSGMYLNFKNFVKSFNEQSAPIESNPSVEFKDNQDKESKSVVEDNSTKNKVKSSSFKAPKLQLDKASQTMGFRFQFSDFPKSNNSGFVTLLSLATKPPKVCYGTGATHELAQDNAARTALADLMSHSDVKSKIVKILTIDDVFVLDDKTFQEETITEL